MANQLTGEIPGQANNLATESKWQPVNLGRSRWETFNGDICNDKLTEIPTSQPSTRRSISAGLTRLDRGFGLGLNNQADWAAVSGEIPLNLGDLVQPVLQNTLPTCGITGRN